MTIPTEASANAPRKSLRGLSDVDPYVMDDPTEQQQNQQQQQPPRQRPQVSQGPFVGSVVPIVKPEDNSSNSPPQQERTSRIVNGQPANPNTDKNSHFVMLLLHERGLWRWSGCGGTLISNCHVLTAGHCMTNPNLDVTAVYVNAHSPFDNNNSNLDFHFSLIDTAVVDSAKDDSVMVHPLFVEETNQADLAVIRMQSCLDVTQFPPARVPKDTVKYQASGDANDDDENNTANNNKNEKLLVEVMGFGSVSDDWNEPAEVLRTATLPFLSHDQCYPYYEDELLDDMVCAGYPQGNGPDACQGDSGGGLYYHNSSDDSQSSAPEVVGIVSWGIGCGLRNFPGVYIYVPYYYDWIMDIICHPISVPAGLSRDSAKQYVAQQEGKRSWCNDDAVEVSVVTPVAAPLPPVVEAPTPTAAPPPTPSPQQQQQQQPRPTGAVTATATTATNTATASSSNANSCKGEGLICFSGSDCCSDFCRGFPDVQYRKCTGFLPTREAMSPSVTAATEQQQAQQRTKQGLPQKRGGAAGAKQEEAGHP